ncbi:protein kinase [Mycobacterium sp. M1]|uniref:non-specific serine/threonine protein kinase n=1 Tax=Mycolicibacter acidiphilus TaxID=2835306 RepID=A0ABS5RKT4_9MYCO|nr:serine/threonine-protein kinase PknD [Mycolicibacter acidiphilus]MBS9534902.1 protein kinase [Mycolicibacter acidiphilus]
MSNGEPDSRAGSQFGPYLLRRLLGRGGMGEVYEAVDTRKGRVVALKLISEQFSGNPVFRERMRREADEAGRLNEPHVVPIHDYGEIDGLMYLDMRLIDGVDLSTMLKRFGPLSTTRAVAIVSQIAAALDAAHANGVMHRDVKPENILITRDDFAYLVDFGIARAATDPGLTQTGTAMGTYNYMAPERFSGGEVTYRADIYSLACVLCECLTGTPPYAAQSIEQAVGAHLTAPAPRPSQLTGGRVPAALDEVIARGMAKNPQDRYRSAGELAIAAQQALAGPAPAQGATTAWRGEPRYGPTDAVDTSAETMMRPAIPGVDHSGRPPQPAAGQGAWRGTPAAPAPAGPPPRVDFSSPAQRVSAGVPWYQRKPILIGAAALVAVIALVGFLVSRPSHGSSTSASGQTVLPFEGINFRLSPGGVALDTSGNVYVTSQGMFGRVLKLAPGSNKPSLLPFDGLYQPQGLAVDGSGAVYVTDFNNRVVKLAAGSDSQEVLPFNGLNYPEGVAVDSGGNVYVADRANNRVVKLAAGSNDQTDLPFSGLKNPDGVAVDAAGNVFVTDTDNNRVLKLASGATTQTVLSFTEVAVPWGITADDGGNVYVTEHDANRVLKLAAGAVSPTVLPFTGLNTPLDVAVDKSGYVYVADRGDDQVVKLKAG